MATGFDLLFSHVIPSVLAFFGILSIANGIMDKRNEFTIIGVLLFFGAGILPFLILPLMVGT